MHPNDNNNDNNSKNDDNSDDRTTTSVLVSFLLSLSSPAALDRIEYLRVKMDRRKESEKVLRKDEIYKHK